MDIQFTVPYTAYFDLEQAIEDFHTDLFYKPKYDPDLAIYDAVEDNISYPVGIEELPPEVIEIAAKALRKAVGGVQLEMELPPLPTLWWEDSVWKK